MGLVYFLLTILCFGIIAFWFTANYYKHSS